MLLVAMHFHGLAVRAAKYAFATLEPVDHGDDGLRRQSILWQWNCGMIIIAWACCNVFLNLFAALLGHGASTFAHMIQNAGRAHCLATTTTATATATTCTQQHSIL